MTFSDIIISILFTVIREILIARCLLQKIDILNTLNRSFNSYSVYQVMDPISYGNPFTPRQLSSMPDLKANYNPIDGYYSNLVLNAHRHNQQVKIQSEGVPIDIERLLDEWIARRERGYHGEIDDRSIYNLSDEYGISGKIVMRPFNETRSPSLFDLDK
jgi:hypothetical protein